MSRKFFGRGPRDTGPRRNQAIRISPLRVIDHNGEQVGVIERDEALRRAQLAGLDLVEISAEARPPVCKIMDYGKHKYEEAKKKSAQAKKNKQKEAKEVRLGRSVKIDHHDLLIRVDRAREFLQKEHPVLFVQRLRGREMAHPEIGFANLEVVSDKLSDVAKVMSPAKLNGRQITMVLAPA